MLTQTAEGFAANHTVLCKSIMNKTLVSLENHHFQTLMSLSGFESTLEKFNQSAPTLSQLALITHYTQTNTTFLIISKV